MLLARRFLNGTLQVPPLTPAADNVLSRRKAASLRTLSLIEAHVPLGFHLRTPCVGGKIGTGWFIHDVPPTVLVGTTVRSNILRSYYPTG